jgi:hypothetical protein
LEKAYVKKAAKIIVLITGDRVDRPTSIDIS